MKRFLITVLMFFSPIIISAIVMEVLLRRIPNDYEYKSHYLDKNSDNIDVLVLGSSHSYYGINPAFMKNKAFNAAYVSQPLFYDWQIIKKYDKHWHHLKVIVLPIDYFSLYGKLEHSAESWRVKDYNIYYGINTGNSSYNYNYNSELLTNKLRLNMARIKSMYVNHETDVLCSNLGWGTEYTFNKRKDLISSGKIAAKRHFFTDMNDFNENVGILKTIISYALQNHVKVLLYTSPAYKTYVQSLNRNHLNKTINVVKMLGNAYNNVFYFNWLNNKEFFATDFYDADHFDERGAQKFTREIDSVVSVVEKTDHNRFSPRLSSSHIPDQGNQK
ncbi:hypothetical protein SNE25_08670 [Mucilaginibacter sabulilitoris]|uniref:DUF1574 domain-containing protein n=1 Tax=Mucilaginibacter sabulilitoris TaxID=1173583 RepID=A0ABZ0TR30_9SPHI|nr:hypothetical protein [Mucilaginibacter sabulilitoris]WPU95595.1 hypothetical protein SNE25_08670 [Mucilaginibacter sabulilitoris]